MESMKDVSKKYTLDYVLDEATRTRAEELYKDFYQRTIAKDASVSTVFWPLLRIMWQNMRHSIPLLFLEVVVIIPHFRGIASSKKTLS
jgi:hypothetical protein